MLGFSVAIKYEQADHRNQVNKNRLAEKLYLMRISPVWPLSNPLKKSVSKYQ